MERRRLQQRRGLLQLVLGTCAAECGAHGRDRTGDLTLTKDVLCQLSYGGELVLPLIGAGCGSRTHGPDLTKVPLWPLS